MCHVCHTAWERYLSVKGAIRLFRKSSSTTAEIYIAPRLYTIYHYMHAKQPCVRLDAWFEFLNVEFPTCFQLTMVRFWVKADLRSMWMNNNTDTIINKFPTAIRPSSNTFNHTQHNDQKSKSWARSCENKKCERQNTFSDIPAMHPVCSPEGFLNSCCTE